MKEAEMTTSMEEEIITVTREKEIFICPVCKSENVDKAGAEACLLMSQLYKYMEKTYKPGLFLKVGEIIYPLPKLHMARGMTCILATLRFNHADSNDHTQISDKIWLTAEAISITDAVTKHGWRVFSRDIWEVRASKAMQTEYLKAIQALLKKKKPEERKKLAIEHLAFCLKNPSSGG